MKNDLTKTNGRRGIALDIPVELLEEAGIGPDDTIILYAEQNRIIVRKVVADDVDDCDGEDVSRGDCLNSENPERKEA